MRSRRILHIDQSGRGGGIRHVLDLARDAQARGDRVTIATPSTVAAPQGARVVALGGGAGARVRGILQLARHADLIHVHGPRAAAWSLPALAARPSVLTYHGLHPLRRPAGTAYRVAGRALIRTTAHAAARVVCVSRAEHDELRALGVAERRLRLVRNGVPAAPRIGAAERDEARRALGLAPDALVLLFLGRLTEAKAPLVALDVAAVAQDLGVVLLVAGDGELEREVRARAGPNVRVLGHRDDVRRLLAAADALLSTSLWEGLPLATLDAMVAGVPVIASDVPGSAEALGGAGILVRGGPPRYRAAIAGLRDPAVCERLVDAARDRALREFSLDAMLTGMRAVYDELFERHP